MSHHDRATVMCVIDMSCLLSFTVMDFAGYNIEFDEEKQRKLEEGTREVLAYLV